MEYKVGNHPQSLTVSIQDNDLGFSLTTRSAQRLDHFVKLKILTFVVPFTKNGTFKLTKYGLSPKGFCILRSVTRIEWLKRITAAVL